MKKVIERIVESSGAPNENDLWLNGTTLKKFQNGEWVAISGGGGGSASSLSDMTDVDISSPSDGDTLVYNATTHKWESGSGCGCSCLPPMIVEGTVGENYAFTPGSGAPTFAEAQEHMFSGGLVYFLILDDGEPYAVVLALLATPSNIGSNDLSWPNPDSGEDEPEPQTYTIPGTVNSNKEFTEDDDMMSWTGAYNHFNNGDTIILQFTALATGLTINETVVSMQDGVATTTNGFNWYAGLM